MKSKFKERKPTVGTILSRLGWPKVCHINIQVENQSSSKINISPITKKVFLEILLQEEVRILCYEKYGKSIEKKEDIPSNSFLTNKIYSYYLNKLL